MTLLPDSEHFSGSGRDKSSPRARRDLTLAWISVALVPVAIGVGRAASTAFLDSQGYNKYESEPPGLGLLAFVLLALIVLIPVTAAGWFGLRASREGRRSGLTAASLAMAVGGGLVLLGLPLYVSRLVGWPVALGCEAILIVIVVTIVNSRGHPRPPKQP